MYSHRWFPLTIGLLVSVGMSSAQTIETSSIDCSPGVIDAGPPPPSSSQIWMTAEYLLWWTKSAPVSGPLVTTGSSTDPVLGAIGGNTTRVLIGNENLGNNPRSGARFGLGAWCDSDQTFGVEANYFFLASAATSRSASVDGFSPQVISVPFIDATPGGLFGAPNQENGFVFGAPVGTVGNGFAGIASLSIKNELQGVEANGLMNVMRREGLRLDLISGFRYVYFREQLHFNTSSPTLVPLIPGEYFLTSDYFDGRTNFYGGQIGARMNWNLGALTLTASGKVGLGVMQHRLAANGSLSTNDYNIPFGTGPGQTFPGGYFALPSNSGTYRRNVFGVVPEGALNVNYQVTSWLALNCGYTFLYMNSVVRPGNQLDRNINGGQSSLYSFSATPPGLQGGPARPSPVFHTTDFWAQGLNFGVNLRF